MLDIVVVSKANDSILGRYRTTIKPNVGEILDTNNGQWIILSIQHDIAGTFDIAATPGLQVSLIVYVTKVD